MKNIWIIFILLLLSCSVTKKINSEEEIRYQEALIKEFKILVFEGCQGKSTKNRCEKYRYEDIGVDVDLSYSHDFALGRKNYELVDSLSTMMAQKIYLDSLNWTNQICNNCDEETLQRMRDNGMIGKRILNFCLIIIRAMNSILLQELILKKIGINGINTLIVYDKRLVKCFFTI